MLKSRIIIHGLGRLGEAIANIAGKNIVAAIDSKKQAENWDFPIFASLQECDVQADVIIDCSHADAVLELAKSATIPLIICTTGLSGDTLTAISENAKRVPMLLSSNMSLGINLISKLASQASKVLSPAGFDIEIIESHHNQKLDAPSGTALLLANAINEVMDNKFKYVYDRSQYLQKREPYEIGISAIRGGGIVGEHSVILAGQGEVVEITHRAISRDVFAHGAIAAAEFIKNKPAKLYTMDDLISN